jgi:hypothetical protein
MYVLISSLTVSAFLNALVNAALYSGHIENFCSILDYPTKDPSTLITR